MRRDQKGQEIAIDAIDPELARSREDSGAVVTDGSCEESTFVCRDKCKRYRLVPQG